MAPGSSATRRSLEQGELADTLILTKVNDYKRARYVLASIGHFGPVINNHFISAPLLTCFYHLRSGTEFLNQMVRERISLASKHKIDIELAQACKNMTIPVGECKLQAA
jgi:hypothetical protein